jgi:hypothetical protein
MLCIHMYVTTKKLKNCGGFVTAVIKNRHYKRSITAVYMNATINGLLRRFSPPLYTLPYSNNTHRTLRHFEPPVFTISFFHFAALSFYFPSFPLLFFRKIPPSTFINFFISFFFVLFFSTLFFFCYLSSISFSYQIPGRKPFV